MFRRRTFLIGCGSLAVTPAMAGSASCAAVASAATVPVAAPIAAEPDAFELRIAGWDPADPQGAGGLWVQVSSSWQVAWR
jgi:hypothetical protein